MQTKEINYSADGVDFIGQIYYPNTVGPHSIVLVCPTWAGTNAFMNHRAKAVADAGYIGVLVDMYGNGEEIPEDQRRERLTALLENRPTVYNRVAAALETAQKEVGVPTTGRVASIGYCFGGVTSLDLVRGGRDDIAGVVAYHAVLTPPSDQRNQIKAKVLVHHGDSDPMVPDDQVVDFFEEMRASDADWRFVSHGGAVHSFTDPQKVKADDTFGYNANAERRSWISTLNFFHEVLG